MHIVIFTGFGRRVLIKCARNEKFIENGGDEKDGKRITKAGIGCAYPCFLVEVTGLEPAASSSQS